MNTTVTEKKEEMFSTRALWVLIIPLIIEQVLNSLMGTADTMMVSRVGASSITATSLVDSINNLVMQVFTALAAGGTVVCSQYLGKREPDKAREAARQVVATACIIALALAAFCIGFGHPLLKLIYGHVDADVMSYSIIYFRITAMSYPFIAMFNTAAAVYRAEGNSRDPMKVSVISNFLNIAGNATLIFVFHMGVRGAAIATLVSRVFSAVVMLIMLRRPGRVMVVKDYGSIRPVKAMIIAILTIGIPNGIENGMFHFGKLAVQSSLSTLSTAHLAAQAICQNVEFIESMSGIAMGLALMTVVGQCIGAGRIDEARKYIKKLNRYAWAATIITDCLIWISIPAITRLAGLEPESAELCIKVARVVGLIKNIVWAPAFVPAYGLRSAGDVKFCMIFSMCVMWFCRVALSVCLIRFTPLGIWGMWIGMMTDWTVRMIGYNIRFRSGKWEHFKLV